MRHVYFDWSRPAGRRLGRRNQVLRFSLRPQDLVRGDQVGFQDPLTLPALQAAKTLGSLGRTSLDGSGKSAADPVEGFDTCTTRYSGALV